MHKKVIEQALEATITEMEIAEGEYEFKVIVLDYLATATNEVLEEVKIQLPRFSDSVPLNEYDVVVKK